MSLDNDDEFSSFLKKIEDVESIVKGLNSNDSKVVEKSLKEADKYQKKLANLNDEVETEGISTKTGYNRTLINKIDPNEESKLPRQPVPSDKDGFMYALEKDAQERYERRKLNEKLSNELKDKGNAEFAKSNYSKAIEYYTEGLQKLKDNLAIYTNRAQAYIKIEKYEEAISDCDWALRINEKCFKAFIHKGRALTYLKKFDDAINEFEQAKLIDPKQANSINDYIKEVERCRQTDNLEKSTKAFLENQKEPTNIAAILNKIYKTGQPIIYYAGGLRSLAVLLTDINQRTLFRTENGFKIPTDHPELSRCLFNTSIENLRQDEVDFLSSFFELYKNACVDCDENIKVFLKINKITSIISNILNTKFTTISKPIRHDFLNLIISVIGFICELTINEYGRQLVFENFDANNLANNLLKLILTNDRIKSRNDLSILASQIVQNFTVEKKFMTKLYSSKEDFQLFIENLLAILKNFKNNSNDLNEIILITITNLVTQEYNRNSLIANESVWLTLMNILASEKSNYQQISAIFINLSSQDSNNLKTHGNKLIKLGYDLFVKHPDEEKLIILIGNIIQNNPSTIKQLDLETIIPKITQNIKMNHSCKSSVKVLALLTQNEIEARKLIIQQDKSLKFLYNLFINCSTIDSETNKTFKENEILITNAILCMTHCVDESNLVSNHLTDTNIVMDLLYLTRDLYKKDAQKNCAILLAKLAKTNEKHLLRLRELHGIEILHSALKNVEI